MCNQRFTIQIQHLFLPCCACCEWPRGKHAAFYCSVRRTFCKYRRLRWVTALMSIIRGCWDHNSNQSFVVWCHLKAQQHEKRVWMEHGGEGLHRECERMRFAFGGTCTGDREGQPSRGVVLLRSSANTHKETSVPTVADTSGSCLNRMRRCSLTTIFKCYSA